MSRSSLTLTLALVLGLFVAGCDRPAPEAGQGKPAASASASTAAPGTIDRSMAGELMPAVALTEADGRTLNLAAAQGRPVLLNLWATWCAPCVKEMPLLDELAVDTIDDLRVVTASQDMGNPQKVTDFFAERDFQMLEPWLDQSNALMQALGVAVLPTTVLYDASGREVWRVTGDVDWSDPEIRAAIDEAGGD